MSNSYGRYGKHHLAKKCWQLVGDLEPESYFETEDFQILCEKVVRLVRRAKREKVSATCRYFNERIGKNQRQWLYEAVDSCKRKGLIQQTGSLLIAIFVLGGTELKPTVKSGYNRNITVNPKKAVYPDFVFEDSNRL